MIVDFGEYGYDDDDDDEEEDEPFNDPRRRGGHGAGRGRMRMQHESDEEEDDEDEIIDDVDMSGVRQMDEDAIDAFLNDSVTAVSARGGGINQTEQNAPHRSHVGNGAMAPHHHHSGEHRHAHDQEQMDASVDTQTGPTDTVPGYPDGAGGEAHVEGGDSSGDADADAAERQQMNEQARRNESEKRRAIQAIMRDRTLSEPEKRIRIQQVMDGRKNGEGLSSSFTSMSNGGGADALFDSGSDRNGFLSSAGSTDLSAAAAAVTGQDCVPECLHYERQCNVVAPCCNRVYGCRICHDEATQDHGNMDRFKIREIVCKKCNQRQSCKTNVCIRCNTTFGEYHCITCNLWMSESTKPFHCAKCGLCRVGGRDNYVHCDQCCMCLSTSVYASHKCIKEKFKNNCPVCQENLFASRQAPQDLPCGHAIHSHCFRTLASFDYRCPVCKKTIVSQSTMASAWDSRAREIAVQPMPPDLVRVVSIICNDCGERSDDRQWHFLGVQCPQCSSFNTVVDNMSNPEDGGEALQGSPVGGS